MQFIEHSGPPRCQPMTDLVKPDKNPFESVKSPAFILHLGLYTCLIGNFRKFVKKRLFLRAAGNHTSRMSLDSRLLKNAGRWLARRAAHHDKRTHKDHRARILRHFLHTNAIRIARLRLERAQPPEKSTNTHRYQHKSIACIVRYMAGNSPIASARQKSRLGQTLIDGSFAITRLADEHGGRMSLNALSHPTASVIQKGFGALQSPSSKLWFAPVSRAERLRQC